MTNKEIYRNFCKIEKGIPIFSKDWWLDAVCGEDNWDVILFEKGGEIWASWPFYLVKKVIFKIVTMPKLTQTLGIYIKYPEKQKYCNKLSWEKEVISELIKRFPKVDYFYQHFHYNFKNWLPFYWSGFKQTTRYTYVIESLDDLDKVFAEFSHAKQKNIKKAEKIVNVKFDLNAIDFYENHKMTLAKQNQKISYKYDLFKSIYDSAYQHNSGKTIYAIDKNNNIHAALFFIWDENSAYDLISTIDPDFRESGAATLLIKEIIKFVSDKTKKFDFEGSMIENVENSFRQFGAIQTPYFAISKTNSKILKLYQALRCFL